MKADMRVRMVIVASITLLVGGAQAQVTPPAQPVSGNIGAPAPDVSGPPQQLPGSMPRKGPSNEVMDRMLERMKKHREQRASQNAQGSPVVPASRLSRPPASITGDATPSLNSDNGLQSAMSQSRKRRVHAAIRGGQADIALNFPGVDVHEAAKAILGDILDLNYAVDPSVSGAITVVTANPVKRSDVFPILEDSLKAANLGLVRRGAVYTIVPLTEAKRQPQLVGPSDPGYGTEAITLRYVGAAELKKLLEPLVPENAISQVDAGRNLIVITGSAGERSSIRGLIQQFDVNWLHGMSFSIFVPKHTDSKLIIPQLDQLLNGDGAPTAGLVRLLSVDRLNGILAVSAQPQYLKDVGRWVEMLDREGEESARRLFVYRVQNGRASDLATVIVNAFGTVAPPNGNAGQGAQSKYPNGLNRPAPVGTFQPAASGGNSPMGMASGGGSSSSGSSPFDHIGAGSSDSQTGQASSVSGQTLQLSPTGAPVTLTSDDSSNAIVVYATASEYAIIDDALHKLDTQPLQVMIEAAITEVTLTNQLQYGVQWSFGQGTGTVDLNQGQGAITSAATGATGAPGLAYLLTYGTTINATLQALAGVTKIEVLSAPRLVVLNNHTAALEVGQQVPISTGSAVSTQSASAPIVNSVDYRDTGVILKVTPRVNDGGLVLLDISQEVSDVAATSSSTIDSPTINERKIASSIAVHDGQTVALGGLITTKNTDTTAGIPVLRHIPVLGPLIFDSKDKENDRTELIVLLTPRVVRNEAEAKSVTEQLEEDLKTIQPLSTKK
jgi:general secretion pathway protein D